MRNIIIAAAFLLSISVISAFLYSNLNIFPALKGSPEVYMDYKLYVLNWTENYIKSIEEPSTVAYEINKDELAQLPCRMNVNGTYISVKDDECNVAEIILIIVNYFDEKFGGGDQTSTVIILKWHKQKLDSETLSSDCTGFSKPPAIQQNILAERAMSGWGSSEKNINMWDELNKTGFAIAKELSNTTKNNSVIIETIKIELSKKYMNDLKSFFQELQKNYTVMKDVKMEESKREVEFQLSKVEESLRTGISPHDESGWGEARWTFQAFRYGDDAINKYRYECMDDIKSQTVSYHKEFIEYAFKNLNLLYNEGKYDELIPWTNIIYGFIGEHFYN